MERIEIDAIPQNINISDIDPKKSGRFRILVENTYYESFFVNDAYSDELFIVLNGSRNKGASPVFKRWSWYDFLPGSMLNIDDPMFAIFPELTLGWYYGTKEYSFCKGVVSIVKEYVKKKNIKRVVFYASSGGASAAILASSMIFGSYCVCINPQIYIGFYEYAKIFEKITSMDLKAEDSVHRNDLGYILQQAVQNNCRYILVENELSKTDVNQLEIF